jgi:hypothetical protein
MKMSWMSTAAAAALLAGTLGATAQVPADQKQGTGNSATKTQPDAGAAKQQNQRPTSTQNGSSGAAQGSSAERAKPAEQDTGIKSVQGEKPSGDKSAQGEKPGGDQRSTTQMNEKSPPSSTSQSKDTKESKDAAQSRDGDKQRATDSNRDRDQQRAGDRDRDNQRAGDRDRDNRRAGDRDRDQDNQRAGARDRDGDRRDRADDASGRKGDRVQFSERERTTIRESVDIERARVNVNIDVNVGAVIPRTVELHPLPAAIIEVNPRYRNYRYVVVRDEIVIINPQTYAVVEVIPAGGSTQARASTRRGGSVQLNTQQRQRILTYAQAECQTVLTTDPDFDLAVGIRVPERIELCPFEGGVVREVDVVQPYRFFVVRNQVVLVDPSDHTIVEVIR